MPTKGRTLKVQRIRAGVKQTDLAARWGKHRNTVIRIEGLAEVPAEYVEGYLRTLATFSEPEAAA